MVEAASCAEAVVAAATEGIGVVAMDVALPDGDGVDATARIVHSRPEVHVLMLTMADDEDVVNRALRAGARGYVLKDTDPDTILHALRTVAGVVWCSVPGSVRRC